MAMKSLRKAAFSKYIRFPYFYVSRISKYIGPKTLTKKWNCFYEFRTTLFLVTASSKNGEKNETLADIMSLSKQQEVKKVYENHFFPALFPKCV